MYSDDRGVFCSIENENAGSFRSLLRIQELLGGDIIIIPKSKTVLSSEGKCLFQFENIVTGERYEFNVSPDDLKLLKQFRGGHLDITLIMARMS